MSAAPGVAVVIASANRPEALARLLVTLKDQTRPADVIVVSVPDEASLPGEAPGLPEFVTVTGETGSTVQRNAGMREVPAGMHLVFFDDDALPRSDYLEQVSAVFAAHPNVVGITGKVVADGARLHRALSVDEMEQGLRDSAGEEPAPLADAPGLYGCNMAVRSDVANLEFFDERLALYGWLDDLDYSRRIGRNGRLVTAEECVAVHQGNEIGGRSKHLRFGYSVIMNAVYLHRKGVLPLREFPFFVGRPALANVAGLVRSGEADWRALRLRGMLLAVSHVMRGKVDPEYAQHL